jgi:hypothetical protein
MKCRYCGGSQYSMRAYSHIDEVQKNEIGADLFLETECLKCGRPYPVLMNAWRGVYFDMEADHMFSLFAEVFPKIWESFRQSGPGEFYPMFK